MAFECMPGDTCREIMMNIPPSFKVAMYVLLFASLGVMVKGLYDKLLFITSGEGFKGIKKLLPEKLNWGSFLKTLFLTGKVPRFKEVAIFHGLIFWGFMILWIATDVVAIHYDTPLKIFHGPLYIVVSFAADIAGLMVLAGISMAYYRRYVKKPEYLSATKPKQEMFMYAILVSLVVIGYLIEGVRIYIAGMPIGEKTWAPVGWALASLFQSMGLSQGFWSITYKSMWFYHMANTMVFVAAIGHTKFSHIFFLPFSALVTPKRRGAVLNPMDFTSEDAETFGLARLSELTAKNKLDLLTCVECGRCTQVCPANNAGKPLNPKTIITKLRDFTFEAAKENKTDADLWENPLYESAEIDSCTTCGACMEECPANIEHVNIIMEAKRYKALTLGDIPADAATAVQKVQLNGNPWGITQDDRFKWADGMDVPVIEAGKKVDFLYYVGCAGSYDAANQKVVKDTVALLMKAGVSFAVMGKTEKCNGDPIRRFGDEYSFTEIAIENIANMRQYDFDKVVTHCPHCLHTIGKEYGKFEDGQFETVHHTELLAELIKSGKIVPEKKAKQELTFHDPCYLGRHHGEYNAPREILKAAGVEIKEMEMNKDKALCCGMGGGNMWYEIHEGEHLAEKRLEHVGEKKVEKLATACSFCMINFNSSRGEKTHTENLEIEDVASILAKTVL
ncbi:cysteine-rich domain protein [Bacteriovorax sp. BSW11_IV]|uniref:heterodisulfide reductase-related iron-sulfur binding cluster n=1 Tax=Bacteriovorax sp. BSW11_IV TaxID=1353529 RepID=UPI000389F81C|nr:heterodisulfide reductase-related iron-sulfur binding cluster [Bacteriovorax sp. BSW11_IV]EQC48313.1 cysteine-rich domain protein [Bacteriovorax sp. BSW11_IV]